jgi:hypothetical protein
MAKRKYVTAEVWTVVNGERVSRTRPKKIFLHSSTKGVIVADGRPVVKIGDKWVYISK